MDSREYKLLSELKQWRCKTTKGDSFLGNDFQTQFLSPISFLKFPAERCTIWIIRDLLWQLLC